MDRRRFLHASAGAVAATAVARSAFASTVVSTPFTALRADDVLSQHYPFTLPARG